MMSVNAKSDINVKNQTAVIDSTGFFQNLNLSNVLF